MSPPLLPRDRERGNSLLLALIVLSSLATLGSLTVVSVQSSLKASTNDRSQTIAMYAAESGGAMAMEFLRNNFHPTLGWSAYVVPNGGPFKLEPPNLLAGGAQQPSVDNPFSPDQNAWFEIVLFNNRGDDQYGFGSGSNDHDGQLIIRATGHGPQGSLAVIEWEVQRYSPPVPPTPPGPPPPPVGASWPTPITTALVILNWRTVL